MQDNLIADRAAPATSTPVTAGALDCDFHLTISGNQPLMPYLEPYWREMFRVRGIDRMNMDLSSYPPNSPLCGRPDWRPATGVPGSDFERARQQGLDAFGTRFAICNCLHGAQMLFSEDLAAVMCDRAARERSPLRTGADAGDGREDARTSQLLADLSGGRET
jgi:hypothetical protein